MKSVSFLRNTWKKWESKVSDNKSNAGNVTPRETQKSSYTFSSPSSGRSMTIAVKQLPLEISTVTPVDGAWRSSDEQDPQPPPSPIYDQYTQHKGEHSLIERNSSRYALNVTYHAHGAHSPSPPRLDSTPRTPSPHTPVRVSARSTQAHPPVHVRDEEESRASGSRYLSFPRQTPSPRMPAKSTYQLLPPIELTYGPDRILNKPLEGSPCRCFQSGISSKHHPRCPRYASPDAEQSLTSRLVADTQTSQKTVHAVLDLSVDSKPRSLYHRTGSTPHLPYKDVRRSKSPPSEHSVYSSDGSEAEHFPLSLFPAPPPLIVRKKIPTPLVLRPLRESASSQSSQDSTPVGTPTTPRFQVPNSPSQSSVTSPARKHFSLRPSASFSPPPFSPPNSPLPSLPTSPDGSRRTHEQRRSPDHGTRPLRNAQSNANIRTSLPFPPTHRLTSSAPEPKQSSLPNNNRLPVTARPRPETVRVKDIQAYMDFKEQTISSTNSVDAHVQWGYAL